MDPTKYVSLSDMAQDPITINRDYTFLQNLQRELALGKMDTKNKLNLPERGLANGGHAKNRGVKRTRSGVPITQLPKFMDRARQNKSGWNKKLNCYMWSIEWDLWDPVGAKRSVVLARHSETITVQACLDEILLAENKTVQTPRVFLKLQNSNQRLVELKLDELLGTQLVDRPIIEFPSLVCVSGDLPDMYEQESESDSSSSESSSDSSSESESEAEPETEPQLDETPVEDPRVSYDINDISDDSDAPLEESSKQETCNNTNQPETNPSVPEDLP